MVVLNDFIQGGSSENMSEIEDKTKKLVSIISELSKARSLEQIVEIVTKEARNLTGSDGVTFILRDGDQCLYFDEEAISPLWKGQKFPLQSCISGWSMIHKIPVLIKDIYNDTRIPIDVYRSTFVKSLVMVPIRASDPIGVIGNYWSNSYEITQDELEILQTLAETVSVAMENVTLYSVLEKQVKDLTSSNRSKEEFLMILSHELRTPLSVILGWSLILLKNNSLTASKRKHGLEVIERNANYQARIVTDLLDVSSIISGKFTVDKQTMNLNHAIEEAINSLQILAQRKNINLHFEIKNQSTFILGDAVRIQQVFNNLINNAIKFTDEKGMIQITLDREQGMARIVVKDNGIGIESNFLNTIFDRFQQVDSAMSRRYGGLGLGLAITKYIVELHGGSVTVYSQGIGKGSTFTVYLPEVLNIFQNHKLDSENIIFKNELAKNKIMAIDDSPDIINLISYILKKYGAEVKTYENASSAYLALSSFQPEVLICDLGMPKEDGITFIRKVRASGNRVPAIALTGYADKRHENEALIAGYNFFLTKPIVYEDLVQFVKLSVMSKPSLQDS